MANVKPSILIVSTSNEHPKSFVELITQNFGVNLNDTGPHISSYSWKIDTKYYTADVDIHGVTEYYQRDQGFNDAVKALIIHTNCDSGLGLTSLSKWASIESECDLEIKLLISEYCDENTKVPITEATEWCRKRGFEFITLHSNKKADQEEEIIKEKVGTDRIVEVLQTCIWPNLQMKQAVASDTSTGEHSIFSGSLGDSNDILENVSDDEMDEFSRLFGQLNMIKESIQSLSGAERKQCAEQMVTALWKAMGGDDDELLDL